MRVAHNSVVDHVRRHKNEQQRVDLGDSLESSVPVEDRSLESVEFQQHVEAAISALNDPHRSIIIMRDIQGLSYLDIEQTLNLSQSQVKVYLHRARRQLRENPTLRQFATDSNLLQKQDEENESGSKSAGRGPRNDEEMSHAE